MSEKLNLKEKVEAGKGLGKAAGFLVGSVAAIWGGIELGELVNNHFGISGTVLGVGLDLFSVGAAYIPVTAGFEYLGQGIGMAVGWGCHAAQRFKNYSEEREFKPFG